MIKGWTTTKLMAVGGLAVLQIILALSGAVLNAVTGTAIGGIINGFVIGISFILCCLIINKFWAATIMGGITGILALSLPVYLLPGFLPKVFLPIGTGLAADVVYSLTKSNKRISPIITGGIISLVNLLVGIGLAVIFVMPGLIQYLELTWSLPALVGALVQGLLSGWFAWLIYLKIKGTAVVKRIQR